MFTWIIRWFTKPSYVKDYYIEVEKGKSSYIVRLKHRNGNIMMSAPREYQRFPYEVLRNYEKKLRLKIVDLTGEYENKKETK